MPPPPDLSILVIARDAEPLLPRFLDGVEPLRHQLRTELVVLIDDRTTDRTDELARARGALTFTGRFSGFGAFKEQGRRRCSGRWLLNLDTDEIPDARLCLNIAHTARQYTPRAWELAVRTRLGTRPLRRGPFANEWRLRMFPTHLGHWSEDDLVHERPVVSAPIARLPGRIDHHSFRDLDQLEEKHARYAAINAARQTGPPQPVRGLVHGGLRAMKYLLLHGGLLLGATGLAVARSELRTSFTRWTARSQDLGPDEINRGNSR